MPPVPPVFVKLPLATVRRILAYFVGASQAARLVEGSRDNPPITSDAKQRPQLGPSVVDSLKRAELSTRGEQAEYEVTLTRIGATAFRRWCVAMCRDVEAPLKPFVNADDRKMLREVEKRIDAQLNSTA
jgi:hypothetical protein